MRDYELVLIISPEVADEDLPRIADKIRKFINDRGGSITEITQWGRRKLAYPIQKFVEGNYVLTRFSLEPNLTKELEADLQLSNEIVRHLLVKTGD